MALNDIIGQSCAFLFEMTFVFAVSLKFQGTFCKTFPSCHLTNVARNECTGETPQVFLDAHFYVD
jgi:hypothetical protein